MEPLLAAALALGTVVGTKALEEAGKEIGKTCVDKTKQFLTNLKQASPDTVTAIEHTPNQPLNYGQVIKEIQAAAEKRPELRAQIEELAALGQQESQLSPHIQNTVNSLIQSNPSIVIDSKLAEKIGVVNIGGTNTIHQTF